MSQEPTRSLSACFALVPDPRLKRKQRHSLEDVLIIAALAMLCGAEDFVDMATFGRCKQEWLASFLKLPNGIPSHDTFNRVFALLDPKAFQQAFCTWTQSLRTAVSQEIVAMDGKALRRSMSRDRSPIYMVSAWAAKNRLVLGQVKVADKSNEITAIPELLRQLQLQGCIVTIDAMGCQKSITQAITAAGAHYCLALKANHTTLYDQVQNFFADAHGSNFAGLPYAHCQTEDVGHGREEIRRYYQVADVAWLHEAEQWTNLRSIGFVESTRLSKGQVTVEHRFYLSSLPLDAEGFARAVRGHWGIENGLHWCLDVSFNEDQCRVRAGNAAQNLAVLRHLTLNLLRRDQLTKQGLKGKKKKAGWDHRYLLSLLDF